MHRKRETRNRKPDGNTYVIAVGKSNGNPYNIADGSPFSIADGSSNRLPVWNTDSSPYSIAVGNSNGNSNGNPVIKPNGMLRRSSLPLEGQKEAKLQSFPEEHQKTCKKVRMDFGQKTRLCMVSDDLC